MANKDCYNADSDDHLNVRNGEADLLSNDTDADNPKNTNASLMVKDANPNTKKIDPASGPSHATFFTYKATDGAAESKRATVDTNFSVPNVDVPTGGAPCQP